MNARKTDVSYPGYVVYNIYGRIQIPLVSPAQDVLELAQESVSTTRGFGNVVIILTKLRILDYAFLYSRYCERHCSYHSHARSPDLIM